MRLYILLKMALSSALNRKSSLSLLVFCIAVSTFMLLGIENTQRQMRESFIQSVSGTDLIAGARGSSLQLMLYSIFHIGGATNNIGMNSVERIQSYPEVEWIIPISLGDSHKGYPVIATNNDYFKHYKFRQDSSLQLKEGKTFESLFNVIIGYEVANKLNYKLGDKIVLSHGNSGKSLIKHDDKPFFVSGILKATGTPIDKSLFISLEAMEAIHIDWKAGIPIPGLKITADQVEKMKLKPKSVTALFIGLKERNRVFTVQRRIAEDHQEPLMAVLPGVAIDELWQMMDMGEKILVIMSILVTITGLAGLISAILAGLSERKRELAILRAIGATPIDILLLLLLEGIFILVSGIVFGIIVLVGTIFVLSPIIINKYGLYIGLSSPTMQELYIILSIFIAGIIACLIPSYKAYRMSLTIGLTKNS